MSILRPFAWARAALLVVLALTGLTAHAQIPVKDVGSIAQAILQLEQLRQQLDTARKAYSAITGNRGFGTILHNPGMRASLPPEWRSVYDSAGAYGHGISGSVQTIIDSLVLPESTDEAFQEIKATGQRHAATQKAVAMRAYDATEARIDQIEALMQASALTQDAQAVAELNARIGVEQALIQNDVGKLQLLSMLQEAEAKVLEERSQLLYERITSPSNSGMPGFR